MSTKTEKYLYLKAFVERIPASYYPIRIKVKSGRVNEEDALLFKKLYEELGFTILEISFLTGWHERTVTLYLHKSGAKMRAPNDYWKLEGYREWRKLIDRYVYHLF